MRLKQLELYGYKSFASRTGFQFGEGITAVVGPNGSGKSNIADAIRWVMGEQSYRNLRAKTTEDMIFAGTRGRPRLGMAEVILTLDNSDGWLPIEYSEVTVGRRAHRSGENENLLNNNRVRYPDIVDLLGVAGQARSTYTVIGQGMVDAALALRPEARRALFEEAAGIAPHLRKRDEALARIQETERNLERVNDILSELRPRAGSLRRQAERAEEYLLLAQDLTELQRIWYGYQWQRSQRDLLRAEEHLRDQQTYLEAQRAHLRGFAERQEALDRRQAEGRTLLEALRNDLAARREEAIGLRREMDVAAERIRLHEQQHAAIESEIQSLASRRAIMEQEVARTAQELAEQEAAAAEDQQALAAARRELAAIENARRALEKESNSQQNRLAQSTAAVDEARARLEQLGERRAQIEGENAAGRRAVEALGERLAAIHAQIDEDAAHEQALAESQEATAREGAALDERLSALREETAAIEGEIARIRAEHDRLETRQELLARLRQELTGYLPGVREVLSPESRLSGVLGTVANLLTVPAELEPAIESALGNRLQNIVTERGMCRARPSLFKRTRACWATFYPWTQCAPVAMCVAPMRTSWAWHELLHCDEAFARWWSCSSAGSSLCEIGPPPAANFRAVPSPQ
jgi:chromosome segregation protein